MSFNTDAVAATGFVQGWTIFTGQGMLLLHLCVGFG